MRGCSLHPTWDQGKTQEVQKGKFKKKAVKIQKEFLDGKDGQALEGVGLLEVSRE